MFTPARETPRDVVRRDAEEQRAERAQEQQGAGDADRGADGDEREAVGDDRSCDAAQPRAKPVAASRHLRSATLEGGADRQPGKEC